MTAQRHCAVDVPKAPERLTQAHMLGVGHTGPPAAPIRRRQSSVFSRKNGPWQAGSRKMKPGPWPNQPVYPINWTPSDLRNPLQHFCGATRGLGTGNFMGFYIVLHSGSRPLVLQPHNLSTGPPAALWASIGPRRTDRDPQLRCQPPGPRRHMPSQALSRAHGWAGMQGLGRHAHVY